MLGMHGLGESLSVAALVAAALEYAILIRHRDFQRSLARTDELIVETALPGLVRVLIINDQRGRRIRRFGRIRRPASWRGRQEARTSRIIPSS